MTTVLLAKLLIVPCCFLFVRADAAYKPSAGRVGLRRLRGHRELSKFESKVFLGVQPGQTGLEAIDAALTTCGYNATEAKSHSDTIVELFQSFFSSMQEKDGVAVVDGVWSIFMDSPLVKQSHGKFNPVLWTGAPQGAITQAAALALELSKNQTHGLPYWSLEGNTLTGVLSSYLQFIPYTNGTVREAFASKPVNQKGDVINPLTIIGQLGPDGGCSSGNCFDWSDKANYPIQGFPAYFYHVSALFTANTAPSCDMHAIIAEEVDALSYIAKAEMPVLSRICVSFTLHNVISGDNRSASSFAEDFFGSVSPLRDSTNFTLFHGQPVKVTGNSQGSAGEMHQCTFLEDSQRYLTKGLQDHDAWDAMLKQAWDADREELTTRLSYVNSELLKCRQVSFSVSSSMPLVFAISVSLVLLIIAIVWCSLQRMRTSSVCTSAPASAEEDSFIA